MYNICCTQMYHYTMIKSTIYILHLQKEQLLFDRKITYYKLYETSMDLTIKFIIYFSRFIRTTTQHLGLH